MKKEEKKFVESWIEENAVLITTQGKHLLDYFKNNSSNYGEVLEKLNYLKKNVSYDFRSKLLLPIVETSIEIIEHEKNTLSIKKEG